MLSRAALPCVGRSVRRPPSWIEGDERQSQFVRRPPFGGFLFSRRSTLRVGRFLVLAGACDLSGRGLLDSERSGRRRALAVLSAVLADAILGDPPSRFHPVAWMGSWIAVLRKMAPQRGPLADLLYGAAALGVSVSTLWLMGRWVTRCLERWRWGWLAEGAVLSQLIAWRGLMRAGGAVARPLERGDLGQARQQPGLASVRPGRVAAGRKSGGGGDYRVAGGKQLGQRDCAAVLVRRRRAAGGACLPVSEYGGCPAGLSG